MEGRELGFAGGQEGASACGGLGMLARVNLLVRLYGGRRK